MLMAIAIGNIKNGPVDSDFTHAAIKRTGGVGRCERPHDKFVQRGKRFAPESPGRATGICIPCAACRLFR